MSVNPKKPIRLKNRTKYFCPDTSRSHVVFSSPYSYNSRMIKVEGYENRLYWQYRYCQDFGGQTFFYTLTYNDSAMPNMYGMNCFDYDDLRDLLTGGFRKQLLRKYGTTFKYFIGAELGDGKGSRGLHNNPHYHILFFLEPAGDSRFPYVCISPEDFRHLVRLYWQGFDEDVVGYRDYNLAKYGIAREGENFGLVQDFRACMYCSKYVCKDVKLVENEDVVKSSSRRLHEKEYFYSCQSYIDFFDSVINDLFNISKDLNHNSWCYSSYDLCKRLIPDLSEYFTVDLKDFHKEVYSQAIIERYALGQKYFDFCNSRIDDFVKADLNTWRNRYCNKCRISHGVGDYALCDIADPLTPGIKVPSKDGFKVRPLSLYYFRKLYNYVVKDAKGSNIYVLNDLGKQYKLNKLQSNIDKFISSAKSNVLNLDSSLFALMKSSDVNTDVTFSFDVFKNSFLKLSRKYGFNEIFKRYGEFKSVYQDRFFSFDCSRENLSTSFPRIDVRGDFAKFLVPSFYTVSRSDIRLDSFLDSGCKNYLSYSAHPYFLPFCSLFAVFDLCSDYFFVQNDNKVQVEAQKIADVKRFHDRIKLIEYYSKFKNS